MTAPGTEEAVRHASLGAITGGGIVVFPFNPAKVQLTRTTSTPGPSNVIAQSFDESVKASGKLAITLSDIKFVGSGCAAEIDKLLSWTIPRAEGQTGADGDGKADIPGLSSGGASVVGQIVSSAVSSVLPSLPRGVTNAVTSGASAATSSESKVPSSGTKSGQLAEYSLPVLQFAWGAGLAYEVTLESVTANYERFTASGIPVQASVNLTLKQHTKSPEMTNPSSGGLPGRAGHTVIAGDSLVSIANATYGSPRAWRALAQANGLDDPLRIGPGSQLFLPSPAELHQGDKP